MSQDRSWSARMLSLGKIGRAWGIQTYATCASRLASSLGEADGQGRDEEAGDRELHV